ncbi:hypothetical protein [Sphingosinicella sp. BN140058]|uniref:hypothetical protein n=1 Tax=Sphingosinicella sp. BN140058 TaxID=1892855 RepID=UPI0010113012|nr:hypothetical protein [Sphingosinicella sp. BN140058]QAY77900.1 hypothetical protein ETR14_16265 [Sphingosinicella sp. BN140058]
MQARYLYRVVVFGMPQGPWRSCRDQARRDAIEVDLGEYDDHGNFYLTVPADIQVTRADRLRWVA